VWAKPSRSTAAARPNDTKEGLEILGRRDRAAHELGQEIQERATESWKRTQDEKGRAEGGRAGFIVVEKSSEGTVHAPSSIGRPLNLGGQTPRQKIQF